MGFNALFEREDVLGILQRTLEIYYQERLGEKIYIGYLPLEDAMEYVIVPRLGMIMQPYPCKEIRKYYYNSYNIRGNLVKNLATKVMVFIATHSKYILPIKKHLYIEQNSLTGKNTVYSVCNRTIRIFDFDKKETVSIQKDSFSDHYFQNQLKFRLHNPYNFIPEVLAYGNNWFSEKIMNGCMLARVTDEVSYQSAKNEALGYIKNLAANTIKMEDVKTYMYNIIEENRRLLARAKLEKAIETWKTSDELCVDIYKVCYKATGTIPTMISHGDLQAGNIWVDKDKVWIIDWETHERRSIWFDVVTLHFSTRYYGGIKKLVDSMDSDETRIILLRNGDCHISTKLMVLIFILEDINFYLKDMLELPGLSGKDSFDRYIKELNEIDWKEIIKTLE